MDNRYGPGPLDEQETTENWAKGVAVGCFALIAVLLLSGMALLWVVLV